MKEIFNNNEQGVRAISQYKNKYKRLNTTKYKKA